VTEIQRQGKEDRAKLLEMTETERTGELIYILFWSEDKHHFAYCQASPAHPSDNIGRKFEDIRMLRPHLQVHIGDTMNNNKKKNLVSFTAKCLFLMGCIRSTQ